jgi:hypothetical protein
VRFVDPHRAKGNPPELSPSLDNEASQPEPPSPSTKRYQSWKTIDLIRRTGTSSSGQPTQPDTSPPPGAPINVDNPAKADVQSISEVSRYDEPENYWCAWTDGSRASISAISKSSVMPRKQTFQASISLLYMDLVRISTQHGLGERSVKTKLRRIRREVGKLAKPR